MRNFCKVNNLQNEVNATSYLFQLIIAKSKMLRDGDARHVIFDGYANAKTSLAYCTYEYKREMSCIKISPFTMVRCHTVKNELDLFNGTVLTAVHEVCHGIIQKRYWNRIEKKMEVAPHGKEWKWTMKEFGVENPSRFMTKEFPMLFAQCPFILDALELFQGWRNGERFDKELYMLCLESKV